MGVSRTARPALLTILAGITAIGFGPAFALDPSRAITQYRVDSWTRADGLPQSSVEAITQTIDGYLWIGTQQGLARFDGVRFTVFDRRSTTGFGDDYVAALLGDRDGTLWIGTNSGLYSYRGGRFRAHPAAHTEKGVSFLYQDRDGTIWVGARKGALGILREDEVLPFSDTDGASLEGALGMAQDGEGRLCFVGGGFHCLEEGRFRSYDLSAQTPRHAAVVTVTADGEGRFWLGTLGDGLLEFHEDSFRGPESGPGGPGSTVFRLFVDRSGALWGGTSVQGLIRRGNGAYETLGEDGGLSHNQVKAIYEDREGSLWVGTGGGGLNRLTDRKFTPFSVPEGLSHFFVHSVLEDGSGALWVGTADGLNRIAGGAVTQFGEKDGLTNRTILGLLEDREGGIWIGTGGGVFRYRRGRFESVPSPGVVFALYQDGEGEIWAGSLQGPLHLEGGRFVRPGWAADLGLTSSIAGDRQGNLWFGVFRSGLVRYSGGQRRVFTTDDGLAVNSVLGIHVDRDDVVWFATHGGGLHRMDGERISSFDMDDGLPCEDLYWIVEDDLGSLWVTCNDGVFSVSKRELEEAAAGPRRQVEVVLYGTGDGMRNSECNGGQQPAGWKGAEGRLWFPTGDGLVSIDPGNIHRNAVPPPVVVEKVLVDDVSRDPAAAEAVYPPGRGRLQFEYTGLSLIAPDTVRFRYRLEGFDEEWIEAGTRRTAFYTNIPPGEYVFRVLAANNDGVWNEAGAGFPFRLSPHYYQTTWFYALVLMLLAFTAYAAHRYRLARALVMERMRTRIATDLHDDIGASLSQIAILCEVLGRRVGGSDPAIVEPLSKIASSSREMIDSMSDIVWAVNPRKDRLSDVVQRMRRFATDTAEARDLELAFEAPDAAANLRLGADFRRQIYLVFKEGLNNAVRHSGCRRVEIELARKSGSLTLSVRDDGKGFDPAADSEGHGLASMRRRAEELGGGLTIDSAPGRGTRVFLEVPLGGWSLHT